MLTRLGAPSMPLASPLCAVTTVPSYTMRSAQSLMAQKTISVATSIVPGIPTPEGFVALFLPRCPRADHPVLHGKPLAPSAFGGLDLRVRGVLQRAQKRHRLHGQHVVVALYAGPATGLGGEQVVPPLLLALGPDAGRPVVAEEAVQDWGDVHARDD